MHLEHVNITVSDLDRAVDFYRRLLGLELRWRRDPDSGETDAAHVGTADQYIAMFQAAPGARMGPQDYSAPGVNHFGFVVDDLDAVCERLIELGVTPGEAIDYEPGRRVYFLDPDGIEVELVEYVASPIVS